MQRHIATGMTCLLLAACETPPETFVPTTPFRAEDYAWAANRGGARILGRAFIKTADDTARICGGLDATLIPDAPYSRALVQQVYGALSGGFADDGHPRAYYAKLPPAFRATERVTHCDAKGEFEFSNLAAGTYYIGARVTWIETTGVPNVSPRVRGGVMMRRVTVADGETVKLAL